MYTVALRGRDKVRPPHLTRETISGGRPADGLVGCVYESFVLGEDCRSVGRRADLVADTQCYRVCEIRYAFNAPF